MAPRRLSLAALTVLELSPAEMVTCAADAGYSCVGLRLIPATDREPVWPIIGDTTLVRDVEQRLAATGIVVLDIEILRVKPDTRIEDYHAALETGARLGARHVLVAGNDPEASRLTERFAALCDLGAPLGLTMNLEPMPWTDVKNLQQAVRVVADAGRPNAGVLIDPIHFDRAGNGPRIPRWSRTALHYAQPCDASRRPTDTDVCIKPAERLMPGDGG
jgi:sugar phosphate isomerase/epimerase